MDPARACNPKPKCFLTYKENPNKDDNPMPSCNANVLIVVSCCDGAQIPSNLMEALNDAIKIYMLTSNDVVLP